MRSNDDVNNKATESLNYNQQIYSFYFLDIPRLILFIQSYIVNHNWITRDSCNCKLLLKLLMQWYTFWKQNSSSSNNCTPLSFLIWSNELKITSKSSEIAVNIPKTWFSFKIKESDTRDLVKPLPKKHHFLSKMIVHCARWSWIDLRTMF